MKQVEILLPTAAPHGFDYAVPEGMRLAEGDIVSVPFGKGESLGVVWGEGKAKLAPGKIKAVLKRHDFPPLPETMRKFLDWAAWYNCAPKGAVLKMTLPIKDIAKEGRKRFDPGEMQMHIAKLSDAQKIAAQQIEQKLGHGFSVTLLDGVTGSGKTEVYFDAAAQVLEGVGGSGDRGIGENASSPNPRIPDSLNPQVLVFLPEIALSVQWLERFEKRFGFTPLVWNSSITPAQKREGWKAIARGEARVVVGARSALFLPYRNLKLIVVDEEHDQSYKQEDGVIYHARDMAVARARFEQFPAVLVSATPSLESYHNARAGKYHEVSLPARHGGAAMPAIAMLDMRQVPIERGAFISGPLREALANAIAAGHQAMLFLNRRGYAPLLLCRHCGHRFECPDCSAWMVLHQRRGIGGSGNRGMGEENLLFPEPPNPRSPSPYLQCHHCNHRQPVPPACPACNKEGELHACGPGVERLEEEVKSFLPEARVAVMASDSTGLREAEAVIAAMEKGEIDLLIGTQMIAKGHHFAGLAVVGVVDADLGLAGPDLRAAERTYQLLHQLSGRAGREKTPGTVYLQSFCPEHPVMRALMSGDREAFLQAELAARKNAKMPPFSRLAAVIVEGPKEDHVLKVARQLASSFAPVPRSPDPLRLLGPAPAPLYRLSGKFRQRLLVKAGRDINLPDFVKGWVNSVAAPSSVRVKVDIDPVGFL